MTPWRPKEYRPIVGGSLPITAVFATTPTRSGITRRPASSLMKHNPLNHGALTEKGTGIGPVTRNMIRARAEELAIIDGRTAQAVTEADLEQAGRELSGGPDKGPLKTVLDAAPESDRWNPVPGSSGHQARVSPSEDEGVEGRSEDALLVQEGVKEAAHDQMLQAARAAGKKDEPTP